MRRLVLSAILCMLAIPLVLALPVVSRPAPAPHPVPPSVAHIDLARGAQQQSRARARSEAPVPTTSPDEVAQAVASGEMDTEPFGLVGVSWDAGSGAADLDVQVRVRTDAGWSEWQALDVSDNGPDAGTADADRGRTATEPLWAGVADGVDVRVRSTAPLPRGLRADLVDPGRSPADFTLGREGVLGDGSTASAGAARPSIIPRSAWGADESLRLGACPSGPQYSSTVKVGFVHHTAGSNSYSPSESASIIRGIYAYHVRSNGWCDIAYNFLVDRYGQVFEGRFGGPELPVIGGHTGGFNTDSFGVAMIGTFDTAPPAATRAAMKQVLGWKLGGNYRDMFGAATLTSRCEGSCRYPAGTPVTFSTISGHRDASLTSCPGAGGYAILPELRDGARAAAGDRSANPIYQQWQRFGGDGGWLRLPFYLEHPLSGGWATRFGGGAVYWSAGSGAHEVHGGILDKYVIFGGPGSPLGFPMTDEHGAAAGGVFNFFQRGAIFHRADLGTFEVHGGIYQAWDRFRREVGLLGYPTADERGIPGGAVGAFERGAMYWSPATDAREVHGGILAEYGPFGGPASPLGYPVTDEHPALGGGRFNFFQGGAIFWRADLGAREVHGGIYHAYDRLGRETGVLGYPVAHEEAAPGGRVGRFERGRIYWSPPTDAHEVHGAILTRYLSEGGPAGSLGYPTSDEYTVAGGSRSDFSGGSILYDSSTGRTTVVGR